MNFENMNFIENPLLDGGLRKKQIIKNSQKDKPLVTIITAVFNGEKYLEECIKSLHNQKYDNIEHIIIDGGSTDKTSEIRDVNIQKDAMRFRRNIERIGEIFAYEISKR